MRKLAVIAIALLGSPAISQAQLSPDLAAVPADAVMVAHVPIKDAIQSDGMKFVRSLVTRLGKDTWTKFNNRFTPQPQDLEALTIYLTAEETQSPPGAVLLRFSKPIDPTVLFGKDAKIEKKKLGDSMVYIDREMDLCMVSVAPTVIAFATIDRAEKVAVAGNQANDAIHAELLNIMKSKNLSVYAIVGQVIPKVITEVPEEFRPLADISMVKMQLNYQTAEFTAEVAYADAAKFTAAKKARSAAMERAVMELAKQKDVLAQQMIGDGKPVKLNEIIEPLNAFAGYTQLVGVENFIKNLPIKDVDNSMLMQMQINNSATAAVGVTAIGIGLLLPAVQKVREAAARTQSMNNLKQIGLAFHNYESAWTHFPSGEVSRQTKKPLLSWCVQILPYIEQENLYRQFKMDEPWDSEHNKKLIPLMPKLFIDPRNPDGAPQGLTHYRVFQGKKTPFELGMKSTFAQITDGTSNTFMCVEANEPTIWTKPDDLIYDPKKPLPKMGCTPNAPGFLVTFCDGSVRYIRNTISEKTLRLLIEKDDGMPISDID